MDGTPPCLWRCAALLQTARNGGELDVVRLFGLLYPEPKRFAHAYAHAYAHAHDHARASAGRSSPVQRKRRL